VTLPPFYRVQWCKSKKSKNTFPLGGGIVLSFRGKINGEKNGGKFARKAKRKEKTTIAVKIHKGQKKDNWCVRSKYWHKVRGDKLPPSRGGGGYCFRTAK
jgi:hypothetical protein